MTSLDELHFQSSLSGVTGAMVGLLLASSLGCGSGGMNTASVKGKVTYNGQPVTGGAVLFTPVGGATTVGKTGAGAVQPVGSFVVGTYGASDGAVIGTHQVTYSPPVMELPPGKKLEPGESLPPSPFDRLVPKETKVEVKKGSNTFDIELVAAAGVGARKP